MPMIGSKGTPAQHAGGKLEIIVGKFNLGRFDA